MYKIATALKNASVIESLDFSNNELTHFSIDFLVNEGFLQSKVNLVSLNLSQNNIGNLGIEHLSKLLPKF